MNIKELKEIIKNMNDNDLVILSNDSNSPALILRFSSIKTSRCEETSLANMGKPAWSASTNALLIPSNNDGIINTSIEFKKSGIHSLKFFESY